MFSVFGWLLVVAVLRDGAGKIIENDDAAGFVVVAVCVSSLTYGENLRSSHIFFFFFLVFANFTPLIRDYFRRFVDVDATFMCLSALEWHLMVIYSKY